MAIPSDVDQTWVGTSGVSAAEFESITAAFNTLLAHVRTYGTATLLNASAPAATLPASPVAGQLAFVTGGAQPAADGTLTGTWPNLTIGTGKITTAMLADGAVTSSKLDSQFVPEFARKTSNQTLTSATSSVYVDIDGLSFDADTFGADEVWYVDGFIRYQAESTGDFKPAWSLPSGAVAYGRWGGPPKGASSITGATTVVADIAGTDSADSDIAGFGVTNADIVCMPVDFLIVMSTTTGVVKLTAAQVATNATKPIVLANSVLRATQVG